MKEKICLKCPDGKFRKFLIQEEGFLVRNYGIYEINTFGDRKIDTTENRESVADVIRVNFPKK